MTYRLEQALSQKKPLEIAEIKVTYHPNIYTKFAITSSRDAFDLFHSYWNKDTIEYREQFCMMLLNTGNKVIGIHRNSIGGLSGTVVDIRQIMAVALKGNARSIILAHNHPSGNLRPSLADIELTKKIKDAGKLMDIHLQDHLILTNDGYYSFADEEQLSD